MTATASTRSPLPPRRTKPSIYIDNPRRLSSPVNGSAVASLASVRNTQIANATAAGAKASAVPAMALTNNNATSPCTSAAILKAIATIVTTDQTLCRTMIFGPSKKMM